MKRPTRKSALRHLLLLAGLLTAVWGLTACGKSAEPAPVEPPPSPAALRPPPREVPPMEPSPEAAPAPVDPPPAPKPGG